MRGKVLKFAKVVQKASFFLLGELSRVRFFDVATKTWAAHQSSEDMPYSGGGSMATLGNRFISVSMILNIPHKHNLTTNTICEL